jgi:hypothetical protein
MRMPATLEHTPESEGPEMLVRVRVLGWTLLARTLVWRRLRASGLRRLDLPRAPRTGIAHLGKVERVLRVTGATCLVRSVVVQRFLADNGEPVDLLIGASSPTAGFRAHAWLARASDAEQGRGFTVMLSLSPARVAEGVLPRGVR